MSFLMANENFINIKYISFNSHSIIFIISEDYILQNGIKIYAVIQYYYVYAAAEDGVLERASCTESLFCILARRQRWK